MKTPGRIKRMTRRDFLKGAAVAAGSGMAVQLAACSPNESTSSTGGTGGAAATNDTVAVRATAARLNPQDFDFRSNTTKLTTLFSPFKYGSIELSHRMIKSAAGSDTWVKTGVDTEMIEYYKNFAKGGIEMVWVENFANLLTKYPVPSKKDLSTYSVEKLVDPIHESGAHIGYQFDSMGATIGHTNESGEFQQATAADLTKEDIRSFQEDIIAGAKKLADGGFDAFEVNAAGNNIGQSFFSRLRNTRNDEYGPQSFENRARFVVEIIQGIKKACGSDFIVQVLINGIEENDQSLGDSSLNTTVEENIEICKLLEAAGTDALHVRLGPNGMHVCQFASDLYFIGHGVEGTTGYGTQFDFTRHWQGKLIANHSGAGLMLDVAAQIKAAVSIPVGTVTYMDPAIAPDFFETALAEGKCDYFIMNRPLTVDSDYVNKLKEGRLDEIAPCTRCLHCHFDRDRKGQNWEHCRVNACTQRAYREAMPEGYIPKPAEKAKKVTVVGAGPAGMEAARIAAMRGYDVSLYEKAGAVGGLLEFAHNIKGPHENLDVLRTYLTRQLELTGVNVITSQEVTAEIVREQAPDVIIIATGGIRPTLGLTETTGTKIFSITSVQSDEVGDRVVIAGANAQATDAALYLMAQGKQVTMVFPDGMDGLGKGQSNWAKTFIKPILLAKGTRAWPNAKIISVGEGEIVIRGETGVDMAIPCDTIIEAMDMLPNDSLVKALQGMVVYAVGDCADPFNIADAIASGNITARNI